MPTSLIAPIVGAGVSFGAQKLFGSSQKSPTAGLQSFQPTGINAGGLSTTMQGGNIGVTPSAERLGFVSNISNTFRDLGVDLAGLRAKVAPGISELRANRLGEIENARTRAIGDLRDNLQRRRVLGSSFGQDAISRAESEFGGQRDKVAAESFLMELEATNQLINQQFNAQRQQFQTGLDELNLEASIAAGLAGKATDVMSKNAQLMAQINMLESQAAGKFFGSTFQPVGAAVGNAAGSGFKNLTNFGSFTGSGFNGSGAPLA